MKKDDFDFPFNTDLIALKPHEPRHMSRMLQVKDQHISHHHTIDFLDGLTGNDMIIMNDTKVIKAFF